MADGDDAWEGKQRKKKKKVPTRDRNKAPIDSAIGPFGKNAGRGITATSSKRFAALPRKLPPLAARTFAYAGKRILTRCDASAYDVCFMSA